MPRDEGIDVRKKTQEQPQRGRGYTPSSPPAWTKPAKPTKKGRTGDQEDDVMQATIPSVRVTLPQNLQTPLGNIQTPKPITFGTGSQTFTAPRWLTPAMRLAGNVSNAINEIQTLPGQVVAGMANNTANAVRSQPSLLKWNLPETVKFDNGFQWTPPVWLQSGQVANPLYADPTLNPRVGFTGQPASITPSGQSAGNGRPTGTVRIAKGIPMIGAPSQPASTATGGGYGGTTYKKKGKGGGGYGGYSYDTKAYSSDRVPSWLMNLTNWNYKG